MPKCGNSANFRKYIKSKDILQYLGIAVYWIKSYVQNCEETLLELCYHWKKMGTEYTVFEENGFQVVTNWMTKRQN